MIKIPATKTPPAPWDDIPWEQWEDWRWQLANRLTTYFPLFSNALKQETHSEIESFRGKDEGANANSHSKEIMTMRFSFFVSLTRTMKEIERIHYTLTVND